MHSCYAVAVDESHHSNYMYEDCQINQINNNCQFYYKDWISYVVVYPLNAWNRFYTWFEVWLNLVPLHISIYIHLTVNVCKNADNIGDRMFIASAYELSGARCELWDIHSWIPRNSSFKFLKCIPSSWSTSPSKVANLNGMILFSRRASQIITFIWSIHFGIHAWIKK